MTGRGSRRVRKPDAAFLCIVLAAILLAAASAYADGPHWYIPEPPESDYLLIEKDEATLDRYVKAMLLGKVRDTVLQDIASVCIRYLREYEDYVAAPDSPEPWHSQDGREKMARYAVETLRILGAERKVADLVVSAFADQVRFKEDIQGGRVTPEIKNFTELNAKLAETVAAWSAQQKRYEDLKSQKMGELARKDGDLAKAKELGEDSNEARKRANELRDEWLNLNKQVTVALAKCQKDLPRSFVQNMTGDIPFLQDEATMRMRDALVAMSLSVVPPLQKLLRHPSPEVVRQARDVLQVIGDRLRKPEKVSVNRDLVVRHLRALKDPRSRSAYEALRTLRGYGDRVLPFLVTIAKDEDQGLRREAVGALYSLTGQLFGDKTDQWEAYVDKRLNRTKPAVPAEDPAPRGGLGGILEGKTESKERGSGAAAQTGEVKERGGTKAEPAEPVPVPEPKPARVTIEE